MPSDESQSRTMRAAGWAFMILLGPLHFAGEIVGPMGHVDYRQIACAFLGTLLWLAVIVQVIGL